MLWPGVATKLPAQSASHSTPRLTAARERTIACLLQRDTIASLHRAPATLIFCLMCQDRIKKRLSCLAFIKNFFSCLCGHLPSAGGGVEAELLNREREPAVEPSSCGSLHPAGQPLPLQDGCPGAGSGELCLSSPPSLSPLRPQVLVGLLPPSFSEGSRKRPGHKQIQPLNPGRGEQSWVSTSGKEGAVSRAFPRTTNVGLVSLLPFAFPSGAQDHTGN